MGNTCKRVAAGPIRSNWQAACTGNQLSQLPGEWVRSLLCWAQQRLLEMTGSSRGLSCVGTHAMQCTESLCVLLSTAGHYAGHFTTPEFAAALAAIPFHFSWDDHDIFDVSDQLACM